MRPFGTGEVRLAMLAGVFVGLAVAGWGGLPFPPEPAAAGTSIRFGMCHTGGGANCVVDGDTFWMGGTKIRIADIDAPETHPPRCAEEARLGGAATRRLLALLNAGPVTLTGERTDRYGRQLRIVMRGGRSIGAMLIDEGLARRWTGRRRPWCQAI